VATVLPIWVGYVKDRSLSVDIRCEKRYYPPTMPPKSKPNRMGDYTVVLIPGTGLLCPTPIEEVEIIGDPSIPYDATLTIEFQDTRYVCTSMTLKQRKGGPPVTSQGLRSIPMASLIRPVVQGKVLLMHEESPSPGVITREPGSAADLPDAKRRRRRPGEDVDAAAVVYAVAAITGQPPTKAVSDELGIPLGTARRLVAQALEAGYQLPGR
jgi:hypothetical protein